MQLQRPAMPPQIVAYKLADGSQAVGPTVPFLHGASDRRVASERCARDCPDGSSASAPTRV